MKKFFACFLVIITLSIFVFGGGMLLAYANTSNYYETVVDDKLTEFNDLLQQKDDEIS